MKTKVGTMKKETKKTKTESTINQNRKKQQIMKTEIDK